MAEARRKTTLAERKEIVEYCITHNRDYKGTASLYDVSYSQVYSWVRKYDAVGEDGLSDKRGHHKTDDEVDELAEDEEENEQAKLKSRWAALEQVVGAAPRIQQVAADLVAHYEERCNTMVGKAMVVAMSREICVHLYNEIIKLRPDWHDADPKKGAIKIVMTGSASDKALLRPHIYSKQVKKSLEKRFKKPDDPLRLVIVRDMWLTGFDAPCMHTMYVDKPMKGHNLMQAIARVNQIGRAHV